MNRLFTAILLFLTLTACTRNGYTIKGEYPEAPDGTKVYLALLDDHHALTLVDGDHRAV